MSTMAEATYSTVEKPWLKLRAARILSSSACGIGLPVSVVHREAPQHFGRA